MIDYQFADGTAVVTGAASGIGEALAFALADRGSHLVLVDRHVDRLTEVSATISTAHPELTVTPVVADLADHDATDRLGARLATDHPETTLVINNAGVALAGTFDELSLAEFNWLLEINFRAVVTLCHHLVPVLRTHPGAHLVNISSAFGLIAPATQTAYAASKFAVRGFTESLRHELVDQIGVTCVHPGGIATRIATEARVSAGADAAKIKAGRSSINRALRIPPSQAAEAILRGVQRRRGRVLIGLSAHLPDLMVRIAPSSYGWLLGLLTDRWLPRKKSPLADR
ncbi:MAG: SDR family NAD(P)-dependent oxidoreductase [Propionibacteriaceae bacterium]